MLLVNYEAPKTPAEVKLNHLNKMLAMEQAFLNEVAEEDRMTEEESTTHYHCNGAYVREWAAPAGTFATGEIHRYGCINILLQGKIKVVQSDGEKVIEAPYIYISQPGEKKALYVIEDVRFLNVHATDETDPVKLREIFTVRPEEHIKQLTKEAQECLGLQ